jgi:Xaa-Pro aminopeptidase
MKIDLDRLMAERNLDALMVMGDARGNMALNYLTGGAHMENILVTKRRTGPLTLVHGSMERDMAAQTGLVLVDRDTVYNQYELLKKHDGDRLAARVDYLAQVIRDQGLHGRLGVYGMVDAGEALAVLNRLAGQIDGELVGEYGDTLFTLARQTKDDAEIAEMAEAGRLTCMVVGEVREFIQGHQTRGEMVVRPDGEPLTIGDVKSFMRQRHQVHGLMEDHGCIFSQGRDAGVPHNYGDPTMPLRLGQSIIFDIFPMRPSGYFHDMTRTWSLGYATDEVLQAYEQCKVIFDRVVNNLAVGTPCRDYQILTCEYFEALGHKTPLNTPGTQEGYVHGLGHGLGLDIHEEPRLSHAAGNETLLQPGHVFSVEPGLYYPERGFGVRVEDTVALLETGELVNLTNYPYDLVLPMKG